MRLDSPHSLRRLALVFCLLLTDALWASDSAAAGGEGTVAAPRLPSPSSGPTPGAEPSGDFRRSLYGRVAEAPSLLRAAPPLRALLPFFTTLLADDFNDNVPDASKWDLVPAGGEAPAAEQNQRLEITSPVNAAGRNYNGYRSVATYDLTGARRGRSGAGDGRDGLRFGRHLRGESDGRGRRRPLLAQLQLVSSRRHTPGRAGLDLGMPLSYNSPVWTKSGQAGRGRSGRARPGRRTTRHSWINRTLA
jgi:hypothetical protein